MRILIVDDCIDSSRLLIEYLSPLGECDVATDGGGAVAAVRSALDKNQPYDLILLDIVMPNMDGHEALQEIRKLEESEKGQLAGRTKIVMVTALSDIRNVIKSFKGLCDAYLLKPFDKNLLLVKLEELGLTSTIN